MTETGNDDLLAALRSAAPDSGCRPSAQSPEAAALLARVLSGTREPGPVRRRVTRRRLGFTGLASLAAASAAVLIAVAVTHSAPASGPASGPPAPEAVRTAVLAALQQDSGDILEASVASRRPGAAATRIRAWVYPAFPAAGQQVRYRELAYAGGKPRQDVESVYTEDQALQHTSVSTTQGPASAQVVGVDYPSRTWAAFTTGTPLVDLSVSPALIRSEIASGGFTVDGLVRLNGRSAVKLGWTQKDGPAKYSPVAVSTLWVDATSYVPLRLVTTTSTGLARPVRTIDTTTVVYQLRPASTAALRALTPPVPAGFTRARQLPGYSRAGR